MARALKDFDLKAAKKDQTDKTNADFDDKGAVQKKRAQTALGARSIKGFS